MLPLTFVTETSSYSLECLKVLEFRRHEFVLLRFVMIQQWIMAAGCTYEVASTFASTFSSTFASTDTPCMRDFSSSCDFLCFFFGVPSYIPLVYADLPVVDLIRLCRLYMRIKALNG